MIWEQMPVSSSDAVVPAIHFLQYRCSTRRLRALLDSSRTKLRFVELNIKSHRANDIPLSKWQVESVDLSWL